MHTPSSVDWYLWSTPSIDPHWPLIYTWSVLDEHISWHSNDTRSTSQSDVGWESTNFSQTPYWVLINTYELVNTPPYISTDTRSSVNQVLVKCQANVNRASIEMLIKWWSSGDQDINQVLIKGQSRVLIDTDTDAFSTHDPMSSNMKKKKFVLWSSDIL